MGAPEDLGICLLELVVKMRRWSSDGGRRAATISWRSETVDVDATGIQRVDGKPRPGKEDKRTLIVGDAMAERGTTSGYWMTR